MAEAVRPRILVVDDEEAILETMTFTFEDDYEVHTSSDARRALVLVLHPTSLVPSLPRPRQPSLVLLGLLARALFFFQLFLIRSIARFVAVVEARTDASRPM